MRFRLTDGTEVSGRSYTEIVQAMADVKLEPVTSLAKYREATVRRVTEWFGKELDEDASETDEKFVKALVAVEMMEKL